MHAVASAVPSRHHTKDYSVAIIDDCLDDCALLEFLLGRSNIRLKTIRHYDLPCALLEDRGFSPDVVLMDRRLTDCSTSDQFLQEIKVRYRDCSVLMLTNASVAAIDPAPSPDSTFAAFERGTLDSHAIGAMVTAAALVGPSLRLQ